MCVHNTRVQWCLQDGGHMVWDTYTAHGISMCLRALQDGIPPTKCRNLRVQYPAEKLIVYKCEGCRSRFDHYHDDHVRLH